MIGRVMSGNLRLEVTGIICSKSTVVETRWM